MTTRTASVSAIPAGRARSAALGMTSVKRPIVQAEAVVPKAAANASKATQENSAKKVRSITQNKQL